MENRKSKKILFIWQADWPWDIRLSKEIKTLQDANFDVSIIARNTRFENEEERLDNINIFRVKNPFKDGKFNNLCTTPFYLNPIWIFTILKGILKTKPDLIIVREIPLALTVEFFAKLFGIKVILDMAEPYPALIKVNDKFMGNPITKFLFKNLDCYKHIEKRAVHNCEHIFVVVEDQIERLCKTYSINKNKISIVSNTPRIETLRKKEYNNSNQNLKIVYTGNVDGTFRDITTVIKAFKELKELPVEFNIVGSGSYIQRLQKEKDEYGIKNVNFLGQMRFEDLLKYLDSQDIGIVPHDNCDYIKYTIPNKIFDYMAHSLPVIVPTMKTLQRVVESTDCGYVYEVCNPSSLVSCIKQILNNREELPQKGLNGYNAIKDKYNWGNDEKIFLKEIEKVI